MSGRLLPELDPDAGISRDEVALFFDREDADAGMLKYAEATKEIPVSERTNPETGEYEYRLGDIETVVFDWRGERRAPNRRKPRSIETDAADDDGVNAPEIREGGNVIFADDDSPDAILLSDDDAGGKGKGAMAIPVVKAAEQAGLSEEDLTARLIGRARLKVVDGVMVVPLTDLRELAEGGSIPKPAKQPTTKPTTDPLAAPTDSAADRRTASMGAALGIGDTAAPTQAEPVAQAGLHTAKATDRPPRRLGAPRRWGS
jgi:hypothetical protein